MRVKEMTALISLLALIVAIIALCISGCSSVDRWNGGTCRVCGGDMEFVNVQWRQVNDVHFRVYVYGCSRCGNVEEFGRKQIKAEYAKQDKAVERGRR